MRLQHITQMTAFVLSLLALASPLAASDAQDPLAGQPPAPLVAKFGDWSLPDAKAKQFVGPTLLVAGALCAQADTQIVQSRAIPMDRLAENFMKSGKADRVWMVSATVPQCTGGTVYNVMVLEKDGQLAGGQLVYRGEAISWPSLMSDVQGGLQRVAPAFAKSMKIDCDTMDFADVTIYEMARDADLGQEWFGVHMTGMWEERWTFAMCGQAVEMELKFNADRAGGAYFEMQGLPYLVNPTGAR